MLFKKRPVAAHLLMACFLTGFLAPRPAQTLTDELWAAFASMVASRSPADAARDLSVTRSAITWWECEKGHWHQKDWAQEVHEQPIHENHAKKHIQIHTRIHIKNLIKKHRQIHKRKHDKSQAQFKYNKNANTNHTLITNPQRLKTIALNWV